ncbi:MAG: thiolase family protein [Betaproteobacteria bacterium]|jgi:acetyl-CoA C-acetyltransferase|nr:thiolase family protein [Betaproteobacteria bacterium]
MNEVVIVEACRTAQGTFGGALRDVPAHDMATHVIREAVRRAGIDPKHIEGVAMGQVYQSSEALNIARYCAMEAELPFSVNGYSVNAACCSSLEAVNCAVRDILSGEADVMIGAGVENMSAAPYRVTGHRWGTRRGHSQIIDQFEESTWSASTYRFGRFNMGMSGDRIAKEYAISREAQDEYALRSQQLTIESTDKGYFKAEIVPIAVKTRKGQAGFDTDEHPRRGTTSEKLAALAPAFQHDGTVTAGNASGVSDGASAVLLMSRRKADHLGLKPLAVFRSTARVGVDPRLICMSPGPAANLALERAKLRPADIGWWEINEAFASVVLSSMKEIGIGLEKVNPGGGGIALGHPVGNSGCRTLVTMVHAMRRKGIRYGCCTIGGGGGIATAAVLELAN